MTHTFDELKSILRNDDGITNTKCFPYFMDDDDWSIEGIPAQTFFDMFGGKSGVFLVHKEGCYIGATSELNQTHERNIESFKEMVDAGVLPSDVLEFNFRGIVWYGMTTHIEGGIRRGYDPKNQYKNKPTRMGHPLVAQEYYDSVAA